MRSTVKNISQKDAIKHIIEAVGEKSLRVVVDEPLPVQIIEYSKRGKIIAINPGADNQIFLQVIEYE